MNRLSAIFATSCLLWASCSDSKTSNKPVSEPTAQPGAAQKTAPTAQPSADAQPAKLVVETDAGAFHIAPVMHGTMVIEYGGKVLWLDPWSKGPLDKFPKADAILITDIHGDHLDEKAIEQVAGPDAVLVAPRAVADKLKNRPVKHVLGNGESVSVHGIEITAVPMYNNTRGPEEGKLFHDKGRGNGYLLRAGGKTVYIAGDTACTEDMARLSGIDHAFLPMNLPYTMPPTEAAECVKKFRPRVVTPYHYRGSDLKEFTDALQGVDGVTVRLAEFYP